MKSHNNFSHLAHCSPTQWEQVRAVINAPQLASGWNRAFELAKSGKAPAASSAKPTPAVLSWGLAFEKAGAVRRK